MLSPSSQLHIIAVVVSTGLGAPGLRSHAALAVAEPHPDTYSMVGVAHGNGTFAAVAESGRPAAFVRTSPEGSQWSSVLTPWDGFLQAVIFQDGRFVGVGGMRSGSGSLWSLVLSSVDGQTWEHRHSSVGPYLRDVAFGGGRYVAIGDGLRLISHDGNTWQPQTVEDGFIYSAIAHGNGRFVAGGDGVLTSDDGALWTPGEWAEGFITDLAYGHGVFVAVGDFGFRTSPDGVTWTSQEDPLLDSSWSAVAFGDGMFLAVSYSGVIATSPDGVTWTARENPYNVGVGLRAATHGNGAFVVTGDAGLILVSRDGGVTWAPAAPRPFILTQPMDSEAVPGDDVYFWVDAFSRFEMSYQWYFNGIPVPEGTNTDLVLPTAGLGQPGTCHVVVSNAAGAVTSRVARVTFFSEAPQFSTHPEDASRLIGQPVTFVAVASGAPEPSWQWLKDGNAVPGATDRNLHLPSVEEADAGFYSLVASNLAGVATSGVARLTVRLQAPAFVLEPVHWDALIGDVVHLTGQAEASPPPSYQWRLNGTNLPGRTGTDLLFPADPTTAGEYTLVASNALGLATSAVARVTASYATFLLHPQPDLLFVPTNYIQNVSYHAAVRLHSSVSLLGYQWQRDGVNLPGQTQPVCFLPLVTVNDTGDYRVVVTTTGGAITSRVARLAVQWLAPLFTSQPGPPLMTRPVWANLLLEASVIGTLPIRYQWQFNGQDMPGQTSSRLFIPLLRLDQTGIYRVVARNGLGETISQSVALEVITQGPVIHRGPDDARIAVGETLWLSAEASGAPFPTLQWRFNDQDIPDATNSSLRLDNVGETSSGRYSVVASNVAGAVTSRVATVTVRAQPPVINSEPDDWATRLGEGIELSVQVSASPPVSFQWQFNGQDIPGATNGFSAPWQSPLAYLSFYSAPATSLDQAGCYTLVASNSAGVVTSRVAVVTVLLQPPEFLAEPLSQSVLAGGEVSFFAAASGGPPPTYQWLFNGTPIPGATTPTLYLSGLTSNRAGIYTVVASNPYGVVTLEAALDVVYRAPVFTSHPLSQTVVEGAPVTLSGLAPAGPPATYFWRRDGEPLLATPQPFLTLPETTINDSGSYTLLASNYLGTAESDPALLRVKPGGPLDRWMRRNPLPQANHLLAVTHGEGLFVAVGEGGTIVTSPNGTNWTVQSLRTEAQLNGVAWGDGLFVAVGSGDTILTSPDGQNWTLRTSNTGRPLWGIAHGNGLFVVSAVDRPQMLTSADGVHWAPQTTPVGGIVSVAHGKGLFVAAGNDGRIITSPDGTNWTLRASGVGANLEQVSFGGGRFVAAGNNGVLLESTDGMAWRLPARVTNRRLLGVAFGNDRFVAVGTRGTAISAADVSTWTVENSGTPDRLESVVFADGLFVAVGENGTTITSSDGETWAKQNRGPTRDLDGMAAGAGRIVIVGKFGTILTSEDGRRYTERDAGTTNDLHGVGFGNGLFVAVGEPGVILTSTDGVDWRPRDSGTNTSLKNVTYGGGLWVAVGTQGTILTSPDGLVWTSRALPGGIPYDLNDVAYGAGRFVIVGDGPGGQNGSLFVSSDGINWVSNPPHPNPGKNLRGITYANGLFVVAGNDGVILVSAEGTSWLQRNSGVTQNRANLRGVTWHDGQWIVVGNGGRILTSTNTLEWTPRVSRTLENLHAVRWIDGTFVAIGNRGTVLQSRWLNGARLAVRRFASDLGFIFSIEGEPGRMHRLQGSADLRDWTDLFEFSNTQETTLFLDEEARDHPQRFYRVITE